MDSDGYYRSLPSRATHRELWRMAKSPFQGLVGSLMKVLRIDLPAWYGLSLAPPEEIPLAELPSHVQALMDEPLGQLRALGFEPALAVRGRTIGAMEGYSVFCLNQDHDTWSATVYARTQVAHVRAHEVVTGLSSQLRDDLWVMTSGSRPRLYAPPQMLVSHHPGCNLARLLAIHRERVCATGIPQRIADGKELLAAVRQCAAVLNEHHIRRGVMAKLSDAEVRRLMAVKLAGG